jgi:hypothetical protein
LIRVNDKLTEVRVRVGSMDTQKNRDGAQMVYNAMSAKM